MPTTTASLATWLELGAEPVAPDPRAEWLAVIVAAVVETIEDRATVPDPGVTWTARQEQAGLLMGGRLWARRRQPQGQQGFDPVAVAQMVAEDADIVALLFGTERLDGFG